MDERNAKERETWWGSDEHLIELLLEQTLEKFRPSIRKINWCKKNPSQWLMKCKYFHFSFVSEAFVWIHKSLPQIAYEVISGEVYFARRQRTIFIFISIPQVQIGSDIRFILRQDCEKTFVGYSETRLTFRIIYFGATGTIRLWTLYFSQSL